MKSVEIELCGHKGKITHIWGYAAQPPWRPNDILNVWIEFDEPHPEGIGAMGIDIPPKEYYPSELLAIIKEKGKKQVAEAIKQRIKEREIDDLRHRGQERIHALAIKVEKALE